MRSDVPTLSFLPAVSAEPEGRRRRRFRHLVVPPREQDSRAHQLEISWQNSLGMTVLGLVGLLYATARCLVYAFGAGSSAGSGGEGIDAFSIAMGITGIIALGASRAALGRRLARPVVGLLLVALSVIIGLQGGHGVMPFGLPTVSGPAPLLLLLTVGLMAYRPLQIVLLTFGVALASVASSLSAGAAVEVTLLGLAALVVGTLLYQLRWGIVDRRLQLLEQRDYLRSRAQDLEDDNERLRAQRSHVLEVAESSKLQSLASLAAGLAHEINNPMGSVYANVDLMARALGTLRERVEGGDCPGLQDDRKAQRSLQVLDRTLPVTRRAMGRISAVLETLESFAHLDRAPRAPLGLAEGLDRALAILAPHLDESITVERDYERAVPPILADAERLQLVFLNLLENAAQAIEEDQGRSRSTHGPKHRISVSLRREGTHALLRIEDDGQGIPPEHLPRLFDPGFTTRGVGVGAGLGLAIAYRVIEAHGGTIEIDSEVGAGTVVSVRLPLS